MAWVIEIKKKNSHKTHRLSFWTSIYTYTLWTLARLWGHYTLSWHIQWIWGIKMLYITYICLYICQPQRRHLEIDRPTRSFIKYRHALSTCRWGVANLTPIVKYNFCSFLLCSVSLTRAKIELNFSRAFISIFSQFFAWWFRCNNGKQINHM